MTYAGIEPQTARERDCQPPGVGGIRRARSSRVGNEGPIAPQRFAVAAPIHAQRPPRQRLAGIPLALPRVEEAALGESLGKAAQQHLGQLPLFRRQCRVIPFRAIHVVDRNERGFAALRQPHVVVREIQVDLPSERVNRLPLRLGVGLGDPWVLVHARNAHREIERDRARIGEADHGRRVAGIRGTGERQMAFAGKKARRRVETDPAGAGKVDLGPRVQVGEVALRTRWSVEGFLVGDKLDQVARCKARRKAELAKDLHQQPTGVATGAARAFECLVGRLHTRLHPDQIADLVLELLVQAQPAGRPCCRRKVASTDSGRATPRAAARAVPSPETV